MIKINEGRCMKIGRGRGNVFMDIRRSNVIDIISEPSRQKTAEVN